MFLLKVPKMKTCPMLDQIVYYNRFMWTIVDSKTTFIGNKPHYYLNIRGIELTLNQRVAGSIPASPI